MNNLEKIENRKLVPVVAKVSAGKSKLLNVLYNINYLECKSGIGTKFVNILRYNPDIKEPCFYHLKLIKEGDKYVFYKDLSQKVYEGEKNIIEANKEINNKLYDEKKTNYEKIFYMTEINSSPFIQDELYLKTHDLCDIPGLSEYQDNRKEENNTIDKEQKEEKRENNNSFDQIKQQAKENGYDCEFKKEYKYIDENNSHEIYENKEDKNEKQIIEDDIFYEANEDNKNKTYLTEIFSIIKNYIDGAIIILTVDKYQSNDNYKIIAQLKKVIQKEIINFLVILNKMDLSEDPDKDINDCKGLFAAKFPNFKTFNLSLNTFIPLSVKKLQNELLMDKNFKDLIYFHLYNYIEKKNIYAKQNNEMTFIDHLQSIINTDKKLKSDLIKSRVDELNKSENISKINEEIISIIKDINNDFKDKEIRLGISEKDFIKKTDDDSDSDEENENDDIGPSYIIKFFYICHLEKKYISIPPISEETKNLLNYFKTEYVHRNSFKVVNEDINLIGKASLNQNLIKILGEIKNNILSKIKIDIKKINSLINEITKAIDFFEIFNVIFVPFLGEVNSGKSTIINGIIGEDILPTGLKECSKRGIIIGYNKNEDETDIRKVIFHEKKYSSYTNSKFYFKPEPQIIGRGVDEVKEVLKDLNYKFNEKEEDSFYFIRTKIKLFDELGLDNSLKKMIYLIDLPGFGTQNIFENTIYLKLMNICNSFVFIVRNSVIKENSQKTMLDKIFKAKEQKKITTNAFIKSCLFIFNNDNEENIDKNMIERGKEDICDIIKGIDKENINLCFFNAKRYSIYNNNYNFFYNLKDTLFKEYKNFLKYNSNIFKQPEITKKINYECFLDYISKKLSTKNKELFNSKKGSNIIVDKKVERDLIEIFNLFNTNMNEKLKYQNEIAQKFSFGQEKIKELQTKKESNIDDFKEKLLKQIKSYNGYSQKELESKINNIIERLDSFFSTDFSIKKDFEEMKNLRENKDDMLKKLNKVFYDSQNIYFNIIETYRNKIKNSLMEKRANIEKYIAEKKYKYIIEDINKEKEKSLGELTNKFINYLNDINEKVTIINDLFIKNINTLLSGKISYSKKLDFIEFFAKSIGSHKNNIYNDLYNELKIVNFSLDKIYEEKGFKNWLLSAFSKVSFLKNSLEITVNILSAKMEYILQLVIDSLYKYFQDMFNLLDNTYEIAGEKFSEEQMEMWKNLKLEYEVKKLEIKNLK